MEDFENNEVKVSQEDKEEILKNLSMEVEEESIPKPSIEEKRPEPGVKDILVDDEELTLNSFINVREESVYRNYNISPKEADPTEFYKTGMSYAVFTSHGLHMLPDNIKSDLLNLIDLLNTKGYVLRHMFSNDEKPYLLIEGKGVKNEGYLPWGKFNGACNKAYISPKYPILYQLACGMNEKFLKLSDPIRAIQASVIGCMLGHTGNDPVDFVLIYNQAGITKISGKDVDWKILGNTTYPMSVANRLQLPIINLQNEDALPTLKKIFKM